MPTAAEILLSLSSAPAGSSAGDHLKSIHVGTGSGSVIHTGVDLEISDDFILQLETELMPEISVDDEVIVLEVVDEIEITLEAS